MPQITESTSRDTITIAGKQFTVPQPYSAGHVLTENEAAALNQTYAENLRNNYAAQVKAADEAGSFDQEVFQGKLDDYAEEYEFGVRRGGGGGRTGDPVSAEALLIARDAVRKAIRKAGRNLKDYKFADITAKAREVLAKNPQITEAARKIVEARNIENEGAAEVDLGDESAPTEAETSPEADAPKSRKGKHSEAA